VTADDHAVGAKQTYQEGSVLRAIASRVRRSVGRDPFVLLLLAVTLATRLFWAITIPAFQAPDEPQHVAYIQSLGEDWRFTPSKWVSKEIGVVEEMTGLARVPFHPAETQGFAADSLEGPREQELDEVSRSLRTADDVPRADSAAAYPPTYYFLASLVYRGLNGFNLLTIVFGLRVLSAVLSTGTMFFNYLTLRRFFDDDRLTRSAALIVAMSPMYVYMGAAVNPDVLVWLIFSVFLYLGTRAFDEGLSPGLNVAIGAAIVAGTLVKQTFLIAVPMYGVLLGFQCYRKQLSIRQAGYNLGIVLAMLAVFTGWLYVSGLIRTSPSYPGEHEQEARTILGSIQHLSDRWWNYANTYNTAWGTFGWLDTPLSERIFGLIRAGSAIAVVGLAFHLVASVVDRRSDTKAMFFVAVSVVYVSAWVVLNYLRITSGEAWLLQGRYFFPIIVPVIALLLRGLLWFVPHPRARDVLLVALVAGIFWLQADALAGYVLPRFYA
jgi:4-amino-4-deoxy-L-arabinose transferase-like glycosyltransferase